MNKCRLAECMCLFLAVCFFLSACSQPPKQTEPVETTVPTEPSVTAAPTEATEPPTEPPTEPTEAAPVVYSVMLDQLAGEDGLWCEVYQVGELAARFYQCAFPIQYNFENLTPADPCDVSGISSWIRYYREDGTAEVILYSGDILSCMVDGETKWFLNEARPKYDWLMQSLKSTIQRVNEPIRVDYSVYSEWDYNEVQGDGLGEERNPGSFTTSQAEEFLNTIEEQVSNLGTDEWDVADLADLFLRCTSAVEITDRSDFDWSLFTTKDAFNSIGIQALMKIKGGYFPWRMDRYFQPSVVFIDGDRAMAYDNNIYIYFRLLNGRWFVEDVTRPCSR